MYTLIDRFIDKLMKESLPEKPLWNIESIKQGKEPVWNYIDGCMMTSLLALHQETKESRYFDFVESFIDFYVFEDGTIRGYDPKNYSTDDICESRVLFDLYAKTKRDKYKKAMDLTYQQIKNHPRTHEGNFWHKKIYPNQVWLDGLFMALPFYTRYETCFNQMKNYPDILHQFSMVRQRMFDQKAKLYYHGYDASKTIFWANPETGLSKNFWLRAMGWLAVAMVDVYDYMHPEFKTKDTFLPSLLKEMIDGLLPHQHPSTNLFFDVVDKGHLDGNYLEASGSALISYAILKGVRLNMLPTHYEATGLGIFNGICDTYITEVEGDLNMGGIVLVSGLGPENNKKRDGSFEYYMSEPIVENDAKGVGPLIMAYTEVKRILKT
ncbi:MAG: glycoside hydrolase family 88 protein [Acholeplasmataceae bacterium]|nr:glycoside hydrolase family 88 protein [Acholeplasmataceae bacterium]